MKNIKKSLPGIRRARIWTIPFACLLAASVSAVFCPAPGWNFSSMLCWTFPCLLVLCVFSRVVLKNERLRDTACAIDRENGAKNRLEALLSIKKDHPLYASLERDTLEFYSAYRKPYRYRILFPLVLLFMTTMVLNAFLIPAKMENTRMNPDKNSDVKKKRR